MDNAARIQLVGGVKVGTSLPGDYSFYGNLFGRKKHGKKHGGQVLKYKILRKRVGKVIFQDLTPLSFPDFEEKSWKSDISRPDPPELSEKNA